MSKAKGQRSNKAQSLKAKKSDPPGPVISVLPWWICSVLWNALLRRVEDMECASRVCAFLKEEIGSILFLSGSSVIVRGFRIEHAVHVEADGASYGFLQDTFGECSDLLVQFGHNGFGRLDLLCGDVLELWGVHDLEQEIVGGRQGADLIHHRFDDLQFIRFHARLLPHSDANTFSIFSFSVLGVKGLTT